MKRIRIIAAIAAVLLTAAVYFLLSDLKKPETIKRLPVVVAAKEILEGQVITDDMVAIKQIPEEAVVSKAAKTLDVVVGTFSSTYVAPGEQILSTMVFKAEQTQNGLAYTVGKGMRAVTVPVDQVTGIAGFLKPEDHVDVMAVLDISAVLSPEEFNQMLADKNGSGEEKPEGTPSSGSGQKEEIKLFFSMILLQDIKVLATGQVMKRDGNDSAPAVVETVTLEVTPEEALRLNYVLNAGNVRLMMRSPGDTTLPDLEGVSMANLIDSNDIRILTLLGELAPTPSPTPTATATPEASPDASGTANPTATPSPSPTASPKK